MTDLLPNEILDLVGQWLDDKDLKITTMVCKLLCDNAVQATQFINNTLTNPVHSQTVRNALKEAGLRSAQRRKSPCLSRHIGRDSSSLLIIMKIGL
jgi:hypothetical protein